MKKPAPTREQKKTEIEQLSQAEGVEMLLDRQKIIAQLQEKLAIAAAGKSRTTSQTSSKPHQRFRSKNQINQQLNQKQTKKRNQADNQVLTGRTRKGFGRVDRTEISSPHICLRG